MPRLLFKSKPTPVQPHSQLWESSTLERHELTSPPPIPELFCVFQRSWFLPALEKGDSTAPSTVFPLLFKLILGFEMALLSSHKYPSGMLLLQCTSLLPPLYFFSSSTRVHQWEYFIRYRRAISGTLDTTAKDNLFQQPRKHQKHKKKKKKRNYS